MDNKERSAIVNAAFWHVRREYTYTRMRDIHWPNLLKELEAKFNTKFDALDFAILLLFIAEEEQEQHRFSLKFPLHPTNRT